MLAVPHPSPGCLTNHLSRLRTFPRLSLWHQGFCSIDHCKHQGQLVFHMHFHFSTTMPRVSRSVQPSVAAKRLNESFSQCKKIGYNLNMASKSFKCSFDSFFLWTNFKRKGWWALCLMHSHYSGWQESLVWWFKYRVIQAKQVTRSASAALAS